MKNHHSNLKIITLFVSLILCTYNHLLAQEINIQIETKGNDAAVYSVNGFMGATKFKQPIDFNKVSELFVVGSNGLFEVVRKEDFLENAKIDIEPFPLASIEGVFDDIKLGQIQILAAKLDPSAPNAYAHNTIYDEDLLNKKTNKFVEEHKIFSESNENIYTLSGVIVKDIVFWDGYAANNHKGIFVHVKWTLRNSKNRTILFEKETTGGYYFGKEFKPKNQADVVETTSYAYRTAVISSLIQVLRSDQMTSKSYKIGTDIEGDKRKLVIRAGDKFCSKIDMCAEASVTVRTEKGLGSGFFISNDGYLITNYHVIENESQPTIVLSSGISLPVEIIRWDKYFDVALLKASINAVTAIKIGEKDAIKNGEEVFAIGSPKDISLAQTISRGVISAYRPGEKPMIQTDVSVNSGNSGGPLLNNENEVIGIVTSKVMEMGVEGIAFAIPINNALEVLNIVIDEYGQK